MKVRYWIGVTFGHKKSAYLLTQTYTQPLN